MHQNISARENKKTHKHKLLLITNQKTPYNQKCGTSVNVIFVQNQNSFYKKPEQGRGAQGKVCTFHSSCKETEN